jgi:hypothetical protein
MLDPEFLLRNSVVTNAGIGVGLQYELVAGLVSRHHFISYVKTTIPYPYLLRQYVFGLLVIEQVLDGRTGACLSEAKGRDLATNRSMIMPNTVRKFAAVPQSVDSRLRKAFPEVDFKKIVDRGAFNDHNIQEKWDSLVRQVEWWVQIAAD